MATLSFRHPNLPIGPFWVVFPPFPFRSPKVSLGGEELDMGEEERCYSSWHETEADAHHVAGEKEGDTVVVPASRQRLQGTKPVWAVFDLERGTVGNHFLVVFPSQEAAQEWLESQANLKLRISSELSPPCQIHLTGVVL